MDTENASEPTITQQANLPARRGGLPWLLAALCLTGVFLTDNSKIVTGARVPIWDARAFYAPEFTLVADHARIGRLLLWDPWVAAGAPDYADPQVGAASPILVMIAAITGGERRGFITYWLLIWLLGPLGLLILARHLGSPPWTAFAIALGYAFCSFYTGHAEHTTFIYSFSFLPLITWRFDAALRFGRLRPAAEAGALWGLSALGGYPELTILSGSFVGLWALGRCCFASSDAPRNPAGSVADRFGFVAVALLILFGLGVLVLSPSYVAFFKEGSGYTDRAGPLSREYAISSNELEPGTLTTFASPYLHRLKYPGLNPGLWPKSDISAMGNYIGALPIVLALLAIVERPKDLWRWWLFALMAFTLACALGDYLPVRGWLYDYYPPTRYFRHPAAFRGYAIFCAVLLAILAARDLDHPLAEKSSRIWKRLLGVSLVTAIAAVLCYRLVISHIIRLDDVRLANLHLRLVWGGIVLISILPLIQARSKKWLPALFCILAFWDASLTMRISQPFVADALFRPFWKQVDAGHKPNLDLGSLQRQLRPPDWMANPLTNENIGLRAPTLFYNDSVMANRFHLDFAMHPVLVKMSTGSDRVWFAEAAATVVPSDESYAAFVKRSESLGTPVLVIHPPISMMHSVGPGKPGGVNKSDAISDLPAAQQIRAEVTSYKPNELSIDVQCPGAGWLLVTDRWSQGWRSNVNGKTSQVFGGNFIFRAVRVQAGKNRIQFYYRPAGWPWLVLLSWGTLVIVFGVLPFCHCEGAGLWASRRGLADAMQANRPGWRNDSTTV
jgi:hypothetical protein